MAVERYGRSTVSVLPAIGRNATTGGRPVPVVRIDGRPLPAPTSMKITAPPVESTSLSSPNRTFVPGPQTLEVKWHLRHVEHNDNGTIDVWVHTDSPAEVHRKAMLEAGRRQADGLKAMLVECGVSLRGCALITPEGLANLCTTMLKADKGDGVRKHSTVWLDDAETWLDDGDARVGAVWRTAGAGDDVSRARAVWPIPRKQIKRVRRAARVLAEAGEADA